MKKVLIKKRKYSYKDIFRIFQTFFINTLIVFLYVMIILGFHYLINKDFLSNLWPLSWSITFFLAIAISINTILHIVYLETGSIIARFLATMHKFIIALVIPIIIFI